MKKILLIQTGGTIAMDIGAGSDKPELDPLKWSKLLYKEVPELSRIADIDIELLFFKDSSDINRNHWSELIRFIQNKYEDYEGFVILHGTDTMAYTASALSFGLRNLGKPVILTGSQVPMSNIRSDARRNLINSIEMATTDLNEVSICFNDHVYRGNRTTKMSIGDFDAFASPNYPPLAEIGLHIEFNMSFKKRGEQLDVFPEFDNQLFLLKLYPGLDVNFLDSIDLESIRAVIIEAFGSGNFPVNGEYSLVKFFEKCINCGIILVITSQAPFDAVNLDTYESGQKAKKMGALGASDMTTEAAVTKMMHLMANYSSNSQIIESFQYNIAGEMTEKE